MHDHLFLPMLILAIAAGFILFVLWIADLRRQKSDAKVRELMHVDDLSTRYTPPRRRLPPKPESDLDDIEQVRGQPYGGRYYRA